MVLSVTNTGSTRTGALEISERPTADLTAGVRCLVPPLRAGHRAQTDYPLTAVRRGRFVLGPPSVRVGDPFGLWEDNRTLAGAQTEVLVVPARRRPGRDADQHRHPVGRVGPGDVRGVRRRSRTSGIRHYRSGDDIRTIHWRASARARRADGAAGGTRLARRRGGHAGPPGRRARRRGRRSSLETAVTLAASISLHLLTADHQMRLTTHTGAVLAIGRDIEDDVLAALAVVEPDTRGAERRRRSPAPA